MFLCGGGDVGGGKVSGMIALTPGAGILDDTGILLLNRTVAGNASIMEVTVGLRTAVQCAVEGTDWRAHTGWGDGAVVEMAVVLDLAGHVDDTTVDSWEGEDGGGEERLCWEHSR